MSTQEGSLANNAQTSGPFRFPWFSMPMFPDPSNFKPFPTFPAFLLRLPFADRFPAASPISSVAGYGEGARPILRHWKEGQRYSPLPWIWVILGVCFLCLFLCIIFLVWCWLRRCFVRSVNEGLHCWSEAYPFHIQRPWRGRLTALGSSFFAYCIGLPACLTFCFVDYRCVLLFFILK